MLDNAIPVQNTANIQIVREEKNDYFSLMLKGFPGGIKIVNSTTKAILEMCDGTKNIFQLVDEMVKAHSDTQPGLLRKDLVQTLILLVREGLVVWKDGVDPFDVTKTEFEMILDQNLRIARASESEFGEIYCFINQCFQESQSEAKEKQFEQVIANFEKDNEMYTELALRTRIFNYTERFYFLKNGGANIGILGLVEDFPVTSRCFISILAIKKEFDISEGIRMLVEAASKDVQKQCSKMKCSFLSTHSQRKLFEDIFLSLGFKKEGVLEKEYEPDVDEFLYMKLL